MLSLTTVEKWIRAAMPTLQPVYDAAPPAVRTLLTSTRGLVLTRMRYGPLFWKELAGALERERMSAGELAEYQNESLRDLVAHAFRHVPYYRRVFSEHGLRPSDVRTVGDLPRIPMLTREAVRAQWRELVSDNAPQGQTVRVFTSGTTGSGLPVVYDRNGFVKNLAIGERQKVWAGIFPRSWRISFFGSRIVPPGRLRPPFWVYNVFERQILMSIFHLSPACMPDYVSFLSSHPGLALEGFPTVLSVVADFVNEMKATVPMKAVFTSGEPLSVEARAKIETAFESKAYDSYGMTEWAGLIQECEEGGYHLAGDFGILEVLDDEGTPVPPGREGYLVWTGLVNRTMPFISTASATGACGPHRRHARAGGPSPWSRPRSRGTAITC
jgi:phenylacetate-CoA ligase